MLADQLVIFASLTIPKEQTRIPNRVVFGGHDQAAIVPCFCSLGLDILGLILKYRDVNRGITAH